MGEWVSGGNQREHDDEIGGGNFCCDYIFSDGDYDSDANGDGGRAVMVAGLWPY